MDLFGLREAIPGIHFEERFPLVGLRSASLQEVLARFTPESPYRPDLTIGRPRRHFLVVWRGNQRLASSQLLRYGPSWRRVPFYPERQLFCAIPASAGALTLSVRTARNG
jgi:hypothetical protein